MTKHYRSIVIPGEYCVEMSYRKEGSNTFIEFEQPCSAGFNTLVIRDDGVVQDRFGFHEETYKFLVSVFQKELPKICKNHSNDVMSVNLGCPSDFSDDKFHFVMTWRDNVNFYATPVVDGKVHVMCMKTDYGTDGFSMLLYSLQDGVVLDNFGFSKEHEDYLVDLIKSMSFLFE